VETVTKSSIVNRLSRVEVFCASKQEFEHLLPIVQPAACSDNQGEELG